MKTAPPSFPPVADHGPSILHMADAAKGAQDAFANGPVRSGSQTADQYVQGIKGSTSTSAQTIEQRHSAIAYHSSRS